MSPRKLTIFVHRASECLTDHLPHGDGLICFSLLNGLAQRGHKIFAFTDHVDIRQKSENLTVHAYKHQVKMHSLAPIEMDLKAERWRNQLRKENAFDIEWRMHPYGVWCPCFRPLPTSKSVIGPMFYPWPGPTVSYSARSRVGISPVGVIHHFAQKSWDRVLHNASLVICATDQHATKVQAESGCREVITLPVIVQAPEVSDEPVHASESLRLAFVGRLDAQKNPKIFLETVAQITQMGRSVHGIIVGDGPLRPELEAFAATQGLTERLTFTGRVPNAQVYEVIASCDWLVSTSVGEPYGRNIAEAMSMGVPTICHASGGPKDFLRDGIDGLLVSELDAQDYADKLLTCTNQPTLASNARQRALFEWSEAAVLDRLEAALLALVERK